MATTSYRRSDGAIVETNPNWSVPPLPAYETPVPNATVSLQQAATVPMVRQSNGTVIPARPILNRPGPTQVAWGVDPVNGSVSPLVGAYSAYPHVVYAPQYLGAAGLLDVVSRAVQNNPYAQQAMALARTGGGAGGGGGMGGGVGGGAGGIPGGPSAQVKTQQQSATPTGARGVRARDLDTYSAYDAVSKNLLGPLGDMSSLQANLGTDSDTLSMIADLLQSKDPAIREQASSLADVAAQQALDDYESGQSLTRQFYHPESADASLARRGDMTVRSMMENRPIYTDPQALLEEYRRANAEELALERNMTETQDIEEKNALFDLLTSFGIDAATAAAIAGYSIRSSVIRNVGPYTANRLSSLMKYLKSPKGASILKGAFGKSILSLLPMLMYQINENSNITPSIERSQRYQDIGARPGVM